MLSGFRFDFKCAVASELSLHHLMCKHLFGLLFGYLHNTGGGGNPNNVYFQCSHAVFKSSSTTEMSGDVRGFMVFFLTDRL